MTFLYINSDRPVNLWHHGRDPQTNGCNIGSLGYAYQNALIPWSMGLHMSCGQAKIWLVSISAKQHPPEIILGSHASPSKLSDSA